MRKVSISQAWDETRTVLARDGKLIATVALALLVLPGLAVSLLLPQASMAGAMAATWLLILLVAFLVTFAGQLSVLRLAMGPHLTVGEAIRHSVSRVLPYIGAFLLWIVPFLAIGSIPYRMSGPAGTQPTTPAALLLLAVSILGIFVGIRMLLVGPVATAEQVGPIGILRRSWELTAGNWWRLFGFVFAFAIGAIFLVWATTTVLGVAGRMLFGPVTRDSVAGLVIILIVQAVTSAIYVVLFVMQARIYVQLAGRHEVQASVPSSGI